MADREWLEAEVQRDIRGEVRTMVGDGLVAKLILTKSGMVRGGDQHSADQRYSILVGYVQVTRKENGKDVVHFAHPGDEFVIPAGVPHMLRAIVDSTVVRCGPPSQSTYFEPYRKEVEAQFKEHQR